MSRSLRDRLAALEQSTGRVTRSSELEETPSVSRLEASLEAMGFRYDVLDETGHSTGFWRRTLRYDLLTRHGNGRFLDILECEFGPLYRAARLTEAANSAPQGRALSTFRFYDTETSGLGTGAGTFPFLHAVAYIEEDEVVLDQYFLAEHSQEGAMLRAMWDYHFALPSTVVVSFNGKTFDWPLLRNRLVMHRIEGEHQVSHIDLLHLSRRLWKAKLGRVSLNHVEEHVLGLTRMDDLPGSEAPARYFAFADSKDAAGLQPVFDHNAMDVCSLVTLTAHLSKVLSHRQDVDSAGEYLALARWHDEWGDTDLAKTCYRAANDQSDSNWASLWAEGAYHKRHRRFDEAKRVWEQMTDRFPWSVPPLVELAKHAEHRVKAFDDAVRYTEEALRRAIQSRRLQRLPSVSPMAVADSERELSALRHRLARIQSKRNG